MTVTHVFAPYVSACPRCRRIKRGADWTDDTRETGQPAHSEWCPPCLAVETARIRAHLSGNRQQATGNRGAA